MTPRYLTKSRFRIGLECPTKLFYTKKEEYFDGKREDEFLLALAEGGFQVGELAKLYYPGGTMIEELDYETSLARTRTLLEQTNVIIYEAAFLYNNLFIRTDLLIKKGNSIELIEVKAKSFDPRTDSFLNTQGLITTEWAPYLYDVAFQKFVVQKAYPSFSVTASLFLTDKSKTATVDGLNQRFIIEKKEGKKHVRVNGPVDEGSLGERLLTLQNVDAFLEKIYAGAENTFGGKGFTEKIHFLAENYANDLKIDHPLGSACGTCEFRMEKEDHGLRSGFHECWREKASFSEADFQRPSVLDLWHFRKKDEYIQKGIYFQDQLTPADLEPKNSSKKKTTNTGPGLSHWQRQVLQIGRSPFIDIPSLIALQAEWKYPYHFIDFETTTVAIPFTKGRRPYEMVAFQFSHHTLSEKGVIEHKGQWICAEPGVDPNFDFVRALKKELEQDEGTIFRYADHENTVLTTIYKQLQASGENDRAALCDWIRGISHKKGDVEEWQGVRDMVDLKKLIEKFYYHPLMGGSISIKQVLPAILDSCDHLKEKYAKPVYGTDTIKSLNFIGHQWIRTDADQKLIDPYQLLEVTGVVGGRTDTSPGEDEKAIAIRDGGAAMSAFSKMQFTGMGPDERQRIVQSLLKYCELDTFAMVLVWEALTYWMREGQ